MSGGVFGSSFYGDVVFDVQSNGFVVVSGLSNHPVLLGSFDNLTSKSGKLWVFNFSSSGVDVVFDDFLFEARFPEGVVFTYIKSSSQIRIGSDDNIPVIRGILKNKSFEFVVQYYFEDEEDNDEKNNYSFILFFIFGGLFLYIGLFFIFSYKHNNIGNSKQFLSLTPRQKDIFLILLKNDGVSQKFLETKLNLPKSSVSRNIDALVRKNLIVKERRGFSSSLKVNKKVFK